MERGLTYGIIAQTCAAPRAQRSDAGERREALPSDARDCASAGKRSHNKRRERSAATRQERREALPSGARDCARGTDKGRQAADKNKQNKH